MPDTQPAKAMELARKWFRCPCGTPYGERRDYAGNSPPDDEPHAPEDFDTGVERMTAEIVAYAAERIVEVSAEYRQFRDDWQSRGLTAISERDAALAKLEATTYNDWTLNVEAGHLSRTGVTKMTAADVQLLRERDAAIARAEKAEVQIAQWETNHVRLSHQYVDMEERVRVLTEALLDAVLRRCCDQTPPTTTDGDGFMVLRDAGGHAVVHVDGCTARAALAKAAADLAIRNSNEGAAQ